MSSSVSLVTLKNIHNLVLPIGSLSTFIGSAASSEGVLMVFGGLSESLGRGLSALRRATTIFGICTRYVRGARRSMGAGGCRLMADALDSVGIIDRCSGEPEFLFPPWFPEPWNPVPLMKFTSSSSSALPSVSTDDSGGTSSVELDSKVLETRVETETPMEIGETAIDRQPPAPIDRRAPIMYRVHIPKIDVARLNALRPKPKPSENPPEAVRTPSEDETDSMEETAIDRQPPAPIDRRAPIMYRVHIPKIDVARLNALRPKPKPSENPPEAVRTPSEDETDSMEVDRVPTGRTLRRRKEKVAKHLKRG
ncbi:hypothetical protein DY000_02031191 [Brassica cretica]|uniref:Uncharacterized protein n=1 Tax=Brassica cretica TaxID=69181 RepID=A0ABQ7DDZ9_BRACR|nr:hypothetical protein DY000_02031191 [Brassica cretica]